MAYKADLLIVGCGFAGATFAHLAAYSGLSVEVIDERKHIGGNCYSYIDERSGVEVHKYGPHIFHTNSRNIWNFINKFTSFNNYVNRVKAQYKGNIYSLPINLHTLNQFFGRAFTPEQAKNFIEEIRIKNMKVNNFEDYVMSSLGKDLYEAFYKYYTIKHWGVDPKNIGVSVAKRLPVRYNYNDNYYDAVYQGIPSDGYTKIFKRMLSSDKIKLGLNTSFEEYRTSWRNKYHYLVFTGSLDNYFVNELGYLPYRKVIFVEIRGKEIQGNAVINYTDMSVPYTRIHEHKWFKPEKKVRESIAFEEYSAATNSNSEPFYPVRNPDSDKLFNKYKILADNEKDVVFLGRLAEFKYYDMDQVIGSAISKFKEFMKNINR